MHTIKNDKQNDRISAGVNLPQHPNEILKSDGDSMTDTVPTQIWENQNCLFLSAALFL